MREYLDIWAGLDGFRVVLRCGLAFEVLGVFRTFAEAANAKRAAERAVARIQNWSAA